MNLIVENILDMLKAAGEEELQKELADFSCPKNPEIEDFKQFGMTVLLKFM